MINEPVFFHLVLAGIPGGMVVIIIVAVIAVIAGMVFGHLAEKKRTEVIRGLASATDLGFWPRPDHRFEHRWPMFECFTKGDDRYAYNLMRGQKAGRSLVACDYHYSTTSRDSKGNRHTHHHQFSAVIVDSGLNLGQMNIRKEGFFDKVTEFFGWDDIDFESHEFSRRFHVTARNRRLAYDLLHQEAMEMLLERPFFDLEIVGPYVLARRSTRFDPPEFFQAMDLANRLLELIPDDLEDELAVRP